MAGGPSTLLEDRSAEQSRAAASLLHLRFFFLPAVVALTVWYWRANGSSRIRLAILCAYFSVNIAHLLLLYRHRREGLHTRTLGIAGVLMVLIVSSLTGGLESDFVLLLPLTLATTAMGAPTVWEAWAGAAIQVAALPLLALIGGTRPLFTSAMIVGGGCVALRVGFVLRAMFERTLTRMAQAHDDILRMHREQMQSLTRLSAEIGRELRAPLAEVAELARLAQEELSGPRRSTERLEELRAQTARMQELLEDFLNFSRPLSPLSLDTVDGARIGKEIVDLFQGVAHERRISLLLSGDAVQLRCDRRKIRQVLVNLVQNAVEASEPGGEIGIEVRARDHEARIRVLDRGRGLAKDIAERLFQAGATTKPRGAGLGLIIARSIAQQHGGTLTVAGRDGGGCAAELMLPLTLSPAPQEGRAA